MTLQHPLEPGQSAAEAGQVQARLDAGQGGGAPDAGYTRAAGACDSGGVWRKNGLLDLSLFSDFRLAAGTRRRPRGT